MTFDMKPVQSSQIALVGYSEPDKVLRIAFTRNAAYQYFPVEKSVYDELMASDSIGSYFSQHIKGNENYKCTKIS